MPKRTDIKTILLIGSGPIVIGQGCEFDYSGTQACKALRAEGFRIVLVNSNPATIMTDPELADRTYIEPITPEAVRKILQKQKDMGDPIHAVLPTLGGQTALNCACKLWDDGVFQSFGVEMIGADRRIIHRAEDRQIFKEICEDLGLKLPKAKTVTTMADAEEFLKEIGLPAIIRPAFTLGGTGGGIAYNKDEFTDIVTRGLRASMIGQVQIDQSVIGWKEYELEVVRDKKDNCIIVCGIENIDPMGVHTGDSITVAPIQTLSDKEYQAMRDASLAIMRAVGVETGGSNVQFAVNPAPKDGKFEMVVVEMNPRVSRSSALASKATGFPIAKIAAKLAVGYTLDELRNDITGTTSACFEPAIDYVVTKIPRWTFEKFPEADETLTTQMKSVGEAMAIGRTFAESFQKAIRSMEVKRFGLGLDRNDKWLASRRADAQGRTADGQKVEWPIADDKLRRKLAVPSQGRLYYVRYAFKLGMSTDEINRITNIDRWFLDQIKRLVEFEDVLCSYTKLEDVPADTLRAAKTLGYSDAQLANLYLGSISPKTILQVRNHRKGLKIEPVYKLVDTCAAEFAAVTPYYYSTYETPFTLNGEEITDDEIRVSDTKKVIILGGGPNRIGQGIEFDYCCCHAAFAADELNLESVMINSNPETVSTDYDTSDLLFFEPLTMEDVLNVIERLNGQPLGTSHRVSGVELVGFEPITQSSLPVAPPGSLDLTGARFDAPAEVIEAIANHLASIGVTKAAYVTMSFSPSGPDDTCYEYCVLTQPGGLLTFEFNAHRPRRLLRTVKAGETDHDGIREKTNAARAKLNGTSGHILGAVVQFGGQTPLNLAHGLQMAGAPIIGTSVDSIDLAEDRKRFDALLVQLGLSKPPSGTARTLQQAVEIANTIGYPVLVRPSYVLGGRGMEICSDEKSLVSYMSNAVRISEMDDAPVLIDRFLDDATEVDVDVVADYDPTQPVDSPAQSGRQAVVCGVMEHIEQAGIHSGDSACAIPAYALPQAITDEIRRISRELAKHLRVKGLMNVQLAVKDGKIYMLEVNPRASRTSPFVGKATGTPWPRIAAKVMMGKTLAEMNVKEVTTKDFYSVKESVFPFSKFPGVDVVLGPEMRSTGEVMGIDKSFPIAFAKSQMASGTQLPLKGNVFVSVRERDRSAVVPLVKDLLKMGFTVCASSGTGEFLKSMNLDVRVLPKIAESVRPNILDLMQNGEVQLIINTPTKTGWQTDEGRIRASAVRLGVPMITTTTGAWATVRAIEALRAGDWTVAAIQDYFPQAASVEPKVQTVGRSPARV